MTAREDLSAADWETLQFAPMWAANIVSGKPDAEGHPKMRMALTKSLLDYATSGEGLAQEVCMSIVEGHQTIVPRFTADARDPISGLKEVRAVLDRSARTDALKFKLAISGFAKNMLAASDEGSLLTRRKVRTSQKQRMAVVTHTLGLPLDD